MYPTDLHFDIASLRGQNMRNEAAHERLLRHAAQHQPSTHADAHRDAAYRRLAVAIFGLDIKTLTGTLRSAQR